MCSGGCRCKGGCGDQPPRIRCTPTFYHHPIFGESGPQCGNIYSSQVYKRSKGHQGYNSTSAGINNHKADCYCTTNYKQAQRNELQPNIQRQKRPYSATKQPVLQKQISFNPHGSTKFQNAGSFNQLSNHTLLWFNPQKEILLRDASNCYHHGISKQRKLLELSSCPFYNQTSASRISRCQGCSKLTNCPFCGGYLSCSRCRNQIGLTGCQCNQGKFNKNQICSCGSCKKCGGQEDNYNQNNNQYTLQKPNYQRLNSCKNCKQFCPCDRNCVCGDDCQCCQSKAQKNANNTQSKCAGCQCVCSCGPGCVCGPNCTCCSNKSGLSCLCGKGKCKCGNNCSCGSNCRCCPKFLAYGTCLCRDGCRCGSNCQCKSSCQCCPKNKKVVCPKQSYQKVPKSCNCGPECGCGPQCRCGPSCNCLQMKRKFNETSQLTQTKNIKAPNIINGTKKTKMQQNVRKSSQPVFKSLTAKRR